MTLSQCAQNHGTPRPMRQCGNQGLVSVGGRRLAHARGHRLTRGACSGTHQGGKLGDHVDLRHVAGYREHVVEAVRI